MNAGETAFTRMPWGARSFAAAFVSPITAAFEAEYAGMLGAPDTPAIDATFTTDPPAPPATIARTTAARTVIAPSTLTSITRRASSSGYRSIDANVPW